MMAAKTAKKTKAKGGKKKATRAKGADRNKTPKLACPYVANLTRPHTTESSGRLAGKMADFLGAIKTWTDEVRKAFATADAAGEAADLPVLADSKFPNLNTGQMTRKAYAALVDEYNEAETPGTVKFPPRYNPVLIEAIHASNATMLRRGSVSKFTHYEDADGNPIDKDHEDAIAVVYQPEDWDEAAYGSWWHDWVDEDGETQQDPSCWFLDESMPRRCHAVRAEELIDNPNKNILTFGNYRYVVGTGSHDNAAAFKIHQTKRGNYRHGDDARKRMSLAGNKLVRDVVFKIEDKTNNGGGFTVKGEWTDVDEVVFMPGEVLTAGNLYDSEDNLLTAKAIRALDTDTKGIKFKVLAEPIVGKVVPWEKLWAEIQVNGKSGITAMRKRDGRSAEYEVGSVEKRSITNICVNGKRVDPSEATPYGLKGGQIHMPAYIVATGEGSVDDGHFSMGVVIGERANAHRNVGVVEARKGDEPEVEAPAPKAAKPKADPKPKAAKKKAAKKDKPAKAAKPKADPPKPVDAAPPLESDTADDAPEPVVVDEANEVETVGAADSEE